jgi:hypothetical protein
LRRLLVQLPGRGAKSLNHQENNGAEPGEVVGM